MTILDELARLSAAEDFFAALGVDYDQPTVNVARLHILRRMGQYLRDSSLDGLTEDAAREACRSFLIQAYSDFVRSSPIEERVFKVHQDAIRPAAPPTLPFVPLGALTGDPVSGSAV